MGPSVVSGPEELSLLVSRDTPEAAEGFDDEYGKAWLQTFVRNQGYESVDQWLQAPGSSVPTGQEGSTSLVSMDTPQAAEDIVGDEFDASAWLDHYALTEGFECGSDAATIWAVPCQWPRGANISHHQRCTPSSRGHRRF
jgi:hypothetical protein